MKMSITAIFDLLIIFIIIDIHTQCYFAVNLLQMIFLAVKFSG